ncbi:MAG: hypothetical protein M3Q79_00290 [bacterium]|nr:hypothetical protein [bacterium]
MRISNTVRENIEFSTPAELDERFAKAYVAQSELGIALVGISALVCEQRTKFEDKAVHYEQIWEAALETLEVAQASRSADQVPFTDGYQIEPNL